MDDLGSAIRTQREAIRMTQEHLAEAAGISARTVQRTEQGNPVSAEAARAMCAVLGVDVAAYPPRAKETKSTTQCAPRRSPLLRFAERAGTSGGRAEMLGGLAGTAIAAWGIARIGDGVASGADIVMVGAGASMLTTMVMDRAWRWAGLYGADYMGRASLAFRATCAAAVAMPAAWAVTVALA